MSVESEEDVGEEQRKIKSVKGEAEEHLSYFKLDVDEVIIPRRLSFEEASKCLEMLGKEESGVRYAYLMLNASNKKLTDVSVVTQFPHLLFVDLSNNKLSVDGLNSVTTLPYLLYLKVDNNLLENCVVDPMRYLQVLAVGRNKIIDTKAIKQAELECLDLNYNYIDYVEFAPDDLPKLKILELRGNLLTSLSGIYPWTIDSLYLAQNRIRCIELSTISQLVNLRILHLRDNLLHKLSAFSKNSQTNIILPKLGYLNVRRNQIRGFRQLAKLQYLPRLDTVVISQNPICPDAEPAPEGGADEQQEEELGEGEEVIDKFRVSVLVLLPNLKRINKKSVTPLERLVAEGQRSERTQEIMADDSSDDECDVIPPIELDVDESKNITSEYTSEEDEIEEETDYEEDGYNY